MFQYRFALLMLISALPGAAFRVSKADFPRFVGVLACDGSGESCPGADMGFPLHGLAGEGNLQDPASPELTRGGRLVFGFPEGKSFSFAKYALDFPTGGPKWVVLNELSSGDQSHALLTLWKPVRDSLEFLKVLPRSFALGLGEMYVHAKAPLPGGSMLLVLKGEGGDAGVGLQDYRVLRLSPPDRMEELARRTNRSDTPVQAILERLNADQAVDPVVDSTLACEILPGRMGPDKRRSQPRLRFVKSRMRILYTKSGPVETPLSKDTTYVDIPK